MSTFLASVLHNHHEGSDTGPLVFLLVATVGIALIVLLGLLGSVPDAGLLRLDPNLGP